MLMLSVVNFDSYLSIEEKLIPEKSIIIPKIPIIFVGNKTDMSSNAKDRRITTGMGEQLARRINVTTYLDCSTSKGDKVKKPLKKLHGPRFVTRWKDENQNSGFGGCSVKNDFETRIFWLKKMEQCSYFNTANRNATFEKCIIANLTPNNVLTEIFYCKTLINFLSKRFELTYFIINKSCLKTVKS